MKYSGKITAVLLSAVIGAFSAGLTAYGDTAIASETGSSSVSQLSSTVYNIEVNKSKAFSFTMKNVKKLAAATSNKNVAKITAVSYANGKAKVTVKGISAGTATIKVYDKKNKSNCKSIKIRVSEKAVTNTSSSSDTKVYTIVFYNGNYYLVESNIYSGDSSTSTASTVSTPSASQKSSSDYAAEILELVNKEREARGIAPLTLNETMCEAANLRASECAKVFDHTRPDGSDCFTVFDDYNISYSFVGENIAMGQRSAEEVMNSWMNSSGHKSNILNSSFTEIGIGYDSASNSWVQLFRG